MTSELSHETNRSTLLLFAHPACPCTRATVEELNRLLARSRGAVVSHAFLLSPVPRPLEWSESGTRSALEMIPGVTVHDDVNGVQARRFGAHTSGHVLLYDRAGNLMFSGGITAARGHIGDNRGSAAVLGSLDGAVAGIETPVFGCALESNPPARREEMGAR